MANAFNLDTLVANLRKAAASDTPSAVYRRWVASALTPRRFHGSWVTSLCSVSIVARFSGSSS